MDDTHHDDVCPPPPNKKASTNESHNRIIERFTLNEPVDQRCRLNVAAPPAEGRSLSEAAHLCRSLEPELISWGSRAAVHEAWANTRAHSQKHLCLTNFLHHTQTSVSSFSGISGTFRNGSPGSRMGGRAFGFQTLCGISAFNH